MLGISLTKTYHDILAGEIPSIRLGKRIIVSRTSFDRWLGGGGKTAA